MSSTGPFNRENNTINPAHITGPPAVCTLLPSYKFKVENGKQLTSSSSLPVPSSFGRQVERAKINIDARAHTHTNTRHRLPQVRTTSQLVHNRQTSTDEPLKQKTRRTEEEEARRFFSPSHKKTTMTESALVRSNKLKWPSRTLHVFVTTHSLPNLNSISQCLC